jgi:hypothetical protein
VVLLPLSPQRSKYPTPHLLRRSAKSTDSCWIKKIQQIVNGFDILKGMVFLYRDFLNWTYQFWTIDSYVSKFDIERCSSCSLDTPTMKSWDMSSIVKVIDFHYFIYIIPTIHE